MLPLGCISLRGREGTPLIAVFKKYGKRQDFQRANFFKSVVFKILSEITGSCFNKREWVKKQFPDFLNSLII